MKLLSAPNEEDVRQFDVKGSMEQILTLLKIARQNKMLLIPEDDSDIRLEPKCQEALRQLRPDLQDFRLP